VGEPGVTHIDPEFLESFSDLNGRQVRQFASQMANLGFARMTEALVAMLDSGVWRQFEDGQGVYRFLPGEYDYFLTQQGVARENVMRGVRDLDAKAHLEEAMDERRTGEDGYRRRLAEVRAANPQRPGRPIEPFGVTKAEAKDLLGGVARQPRPDRAALGEATRRFSNTGGRTSIRPSREAVPLWMRLRNSAERLNDDDLRALLDALKAEHRRRASTGSQDR
jgi:hypothetical protein